MKKTEIFFPFEPKPKGRPRFGRSGHAYTPQKTRDYEEQIRDYYISCTDDYYSSAIKVKLIFYMPIPKHISKKKRALMESNEIKCIVHNGDVDNLAKAVTDALLNVAYEDDCLITKLNIEKRYAQSTPGTLMEITEDVN